MCPRDSLLRNPNSIIHSNYRVIDINSIPNIKIPLNPSTFLAGLVKAGRLHEGLRARLIRKGMKRFPKNTRLIEIKHWILVESESDDAEEEIEEGEEARVRDDDGLAGLLARLGLDHGVALEP